MMTETVLDSTHFLIVLGDWGIKKARYATKYPGYTDYYVYAHHCCVSVVNSAKRMFTGGGNWIQCHKCKTPVPDDVGALLTLYNSELRDDSGWPDPNWN